MRGPLFLRDPPSASSSVASYVNSLCLGELGNVHSCSYTEYVVVYNTMVYTTAVGGSPGGVSCDARSHTMAVGESVIERMLWCNCTCTVKTVWLWVMDGYGKGMYMYNGCPLIGT